MASIRHRDGKYHVILSYTDGTGKRRQKWYSFEKKKDAVKKKKELEYEQVVDGLTIPACTTVNELMQQYIEMYGKKKWALSTFQSNISLIQTYILPVIGNKSLHEITTLFIEKYYDQLLQVPSDQKRLSRKSEFPTTSTSRVRDIHKLLRSCFRQAVKWQLMDRNPCIDAEVPKHVGKKRDIWTADTLMKALELCEDKRLALAIHLSFACSLRIGEILGLTWDNVDISEEAVRENRAYIRINKILQRVNKNALKELNEKDVLLVFPETSKRNTTVRVLKTPKTESSSRCVFLPASVAHMLQEHKKEQERAKEILGEEYWNYNLVISTDFGLPVEGSTIRAGLEKLIQENHLPPIVFHSLRHMSITYKLKLNGGDIKAVQGDSGHAQSSMVTDVYSHILDDDRRRNAQLIEEAFYGNPTSECKSPAKDLQSLPLPEGIDADMLVSLLSNPEMAALITSLAKTLKRQ